DTLVQYYRCFHLDTINVALTDLLYPVTTEVLFGRTKVHPQVMVWNRSNVKLDSLGITALVYDNVGALYDSITEVLPRLGIGASLPYTFTSCYRVPNAPGKYTLRVRLELPEGDVSPKDNEIQNQFRSRVRPDTIDVAVTELLYPVAMEALTGHTEVKPQVRVWNRSNLELEDLELTALVYDSAGALLDSLSGVIPEIGVDSQTVFQFSAAYRVPNADGTYTLLVRLKAPEGDTCPANNEIRRLLLSKRNHAVDLQLLAVSLYDTGVLKGGSWVRPKVRVANPLPNTEVERVKMFVDVYDSSRVLAALSGVVARIGMSDTVELVLADTFQVPDYTGSFWLKAYLQADSSETDCSNDTLLAEFRCQSTDAVREVVKSDWQLGQNIPNPASGQTLIPVTLPKEGALQLSLFSAEGRLLRRETVEAQPGENRLSMDVSGLAAGLYFYSVEYNGERQVRKMTVR
ncbi:MAG: T9SS type A sorting domain-containing protein, partial [Bacteroidales bacterium]|nr:T9SS type A sorting domain-containing protein [Bacteroidales bacterium]